MYDAAVAAVSETDKAVGTIYKAAEANGYILLITADHGNAEQVRYCYCCNSVLPMLMVLLCPFLNGFCSRNVMACDDIR